MLLFTNALFLRLHIRKMVPLGVYEWTRGQKVHSVCAALHGID